MAKRSRRSRQKDRAPRLPSAQMVRPNAAESVHATTPQAVASSAEPAPSLADEYRYVISDLKRIAVLAAIMLSALIALAFLLT